MQHLKQFCLCYYLLQVPISRFRCINPRFRSIFGATHSGHRKMACKNGLRQVVKFSYCPSQKGPISILQFGHHFACKLLRYATAVTITCDRPVVRAGQRLTGVFAGLTFNPQFSVEVRIASKSRMACGRLLRAKAFSQIGLENWHVAPRGMLATSTAGQYAILMLLHSECDAGIVAQFSPVNLL